MSNAQRHQNHPPYSSVLDVLVEESSSIKNLKDLSYLSLQNNRLGYGQKVFKDYILSPEVYPLKLHFDN
jgi:hypothetical protein